MKWIERVTAERDKSHPFYSSRHYLVDGKVFVEKRIPIWRNNQGECGLHVLFHCYECNDAEQQCVGGLFLITVGMRFGNQFVAGDI